MSATPHGAHTLDVRYGQIDAAFVDQLRGLPPEQDGPLLMLNLMRYREVADYQDGRDEAPISGREADDRYAPLEILAELGAEVVLFGDVVEQVRGDEGWERVGIVRYPSARVFLEMNDRADFAARHVHKDAGMERTIISLCRGEPRGLAGATSVLVDLVEADPLPEGALRVEGSPVGDGRLWSGVRLTALQDAVAPELIGAATQATTVTMRPFLNAL